MLLSKIEGAQCWTAETYAKQESFIDINDVFDASEDSPSENFNVYDEQGPTLKKLALRITNICEHGQGFVVLKGLSLEKFPETILLKFYLALSSQIGLLVSQNFNGDKVVPVSNKMLGRLSDRNVRAYNTNQGLNFHSDSADITGLLCICNSQEGGDSLVVSAANIHNLLLAEYKEFLSIFYHGFIYDSRGEEAAGLMPAFRNSVFHYSDDKKLSCRFYLADYILPGLKKVGFKPSETELRALDIFTRLCMDPKNYISFKLDSGDIVFYGNNTVLHGRTPFESQPTESENRLLYRVWINPHVSRAFPEDFAKFRFGYDDQV